MHLSSEIIRDIMSDHECWVIPVIVIVVVCVPSIIFALLKPEPGTVLLDMVTHPAGLTVLLSISVLIIVLKLTKKRVPQEHKADHKALEAGLPTSLPAKEYPQTLPTVLPDTECPPPYDVVIKSPEAYISYTGPGSIAHPPPTMYYCYCNSGDAAATAVASSCKSCNSQPPVPYSIDLNQDTASQPEGIQACSDPFLPSYSEAVKV